jgi:P4 family phage/plasmid primase-like protien
VGGVVCERLDGPRYELDELEEWMAEQQPVLTRKPVEPQPGRKADPEADPEAAPEDDGNPFLKHAREHGYKPRLDVEAALAGMAEGNIHDTQLRVSASLISAGQPIEEAIGIIMERTREVAGPNWNWRTEEKTVRGMCESALKKFPPKPSLPPDDDPPGVVDLGEARARRKPKMKATATHILLAESVLAVIRQRGEDLIFTEKGDYRYVDKLWQMETDRSLHAWLNSAIEEGARALKMESANRLINEARGYILRDPDLHVRGIQFDGHRQIPTRSGLVDPHTGQVTAPMPAHYCTWRVEYDYDPAAKCPFWLQMLEDVFSDRSPESRALHVQLLQEMLGAGLVDTRPKALSRAAILVGGSNYGKSSLIDVMAGLFGDDRNTTPMDALGSAHGLMPFARRVPWVLHEAFDAGRWHVSSIVKAIISGDKIQINVKGGKIYDHRVTVPIFWGSNAPPQFKEATDAITNRLVVIECQRKFDPDNLVGAALEAKNRQFESPQGLVLAMEMPGVLAWAVEGVRRALARGYFILPEESKAAAEAIKIDSNLVAGFIRDCTEFDPNKMISTADFAAAFASWWLENKGEGSAIPRSERLGWAIKAYGDPRIAKDREELRREHHRYYAGICLTPEGRRHWNNTVTSDAFVFQGRTANTSDPAEGPTRMIPDDWEGKPVIRAMHSAYEKMRDRSKDGQTGSVMPEKTVSDDIPF